MHLSWGYIYIYYIRDYILLRARMNRSFFISAYFRIFFYVFSRIIDFKLMYIQTPACIGIAGGEDVLFYANPVHAGVCTIHRMQD